MRRSAAARQSNTRDRLVLGATILGSALPFIDYSALDVALPVIQRELALDLVEVQWIALSYLVVLSALVLVGGALGDLYGRRRVYVLGVCLFGSSSVLCGLAPDFSLLIVGRALQGMGAALLVPGSLAIINAYFPQSAQPRAIGIWSAWSALTTIAGPVLGGFLTHHLSWRLIFFINVPLAGLVLWLLYRGVPESRNPDAARLDIVGASTMTVALGAMAFGLLEGRRLGWDALSVQMSLWAAAALLPGFVLWQSYLERRGRRPMLPMSLFRVRNFTGANLLTLIFYAALFGWMFFLNFELMHVEGYTALQAGLARLPFVVMMFLLSMQMDPLVRRFGARALLTIGPTLAGVGLLLIALRLGAGNYWQVYLLPLLVTSVGLALTVAPLTSTVMGSLARSDSGIASGVNNAVARVAAVPAIAVLGIMAAVDFSEGLDRRLDQLPLSVSARATLDSPRSRMRLTDMPLPRMPPDHHRAVRAAIGASFRETFRGMTWWCGLLCVISGGMALLMLEGRIGAAARVRSTAVRELRR